MKSSTFKISKHAALLATATLAASFLVFSATSTTVKADTSTPVYVYRLYNSSTSEHLYSTDTHEVATLTGQGWSYENVTFDAPSSGTAVDRLYNPTSGQHVYSSDPHEQSVLSSEGWKNEGAVFYVNSTSTSSASIAITRLYNSASSQHLFSSDPNEINSLTNQGWKNEGTMGYAAPATSQPAPTPIVPAMNLNQIAQGNYSSIQGTWRNSQGDSFIVKGNHITWYESAISATIQINGLTMTNYNTPCTLVPSYYNGFLNFGFQIINPTNAPYLDGAISFSPAGGNHIGSNDDNSKDRIWATTGSAGPDPTPWVMYRQ